jgi:peptidoglycan-associated lipoprotein
MSFEHLTLKYRAALACPFACLACATATFVSGCAKHDVAPEAEDPTIANSTQGSMVLRAAEPPSAPAPAQTTTTSSATIQVGRGLTEACNLSFDTVENAPKFDFDQSVLLPDDRAVLDQIAKCVTTGPLQGRGLHLIGRADPRGEVEYNMALGESRADSVRDYLVGLGVAKSNIGETSRGKLDATGTDEAGWRMDRRVDVDLM